MPFDDDVRDAKRPPALPDPLAVWPTFAELVRRRLEAGRRAYGDRSFSADPTALVGELQQEALDLAGWGFVLFCRLEAMARALERAKLSTPDREVDATAFLEWLRTGEGPYPLGDTVTLALSLLDVMTPEERMRFALESGPTVHGSERRAVRVESGAVVAPGPDAPAMEAGATLTRFHRSDGVEVHPTPMDASPGPLGAAGPSADSAHGINSQRGAR